MNLIVLRRRFQFLTVRRTIALLKGHMFSAMQAPGENKDDSYESEEDGEEELDEKDPTAKKNKDKLHT